MSFKRSDLAALGIEPEKIQTLIDWHSETVKALQAKLDESKDTADKLAKVQAELAQVKKDLSTATKTIETANKDDYKGKYETVTAELETLKSEYAAKETATAKKAALTAELKQAGYSDRAINLIVRNGFADGVEIGEDGKATNLATVVQSIQSDADFSGFTPKTEDTSHHPANPPANAGGKKALTWDDIDKIKDAEERQKAMLENMEALGIN